MFNKLKIVIYIAINILFILKYVGRTAINPYYCASIYAIVCTAVYVLLYKGIKTEKMARNLFYGLLTCTVAGILLLLYKVDPMTVRVDRWSATTYFLDGLFEGVYPYGIHTHVCQSNFPSPFPMWQYINIPFWLMGDVGLGLVAFLLLFVFMIRWFTNSWKTTVLALILLMLAPCYWWEVLVRSDGLSNAILVFCVILWMEKQKISFLNHWVLTAIICGMVASTRLSAIIPMALYVANSYFKSNALRMSLSPVIALAVLGFFFVPYIFWDTTTWVFFSRNPFMSQSSTGNIWILLVMAAIALATILLYNKDINRYMRSTAAFVFCFFLAAICYNHAVRHADIPFFADADFDISYLTLSLPYCLYSLTIINPKTKDEKHNNITAGIQ